MTLQELVDVTDIAIDVVTPKQGYLFTVPRNSQSLLISKAFKDCKVELIYRDEIMNLNKDHLAVAIILETDKRG